MINRKIKLAIIGLGYVGLPLALAFSKNRYVIGFDNNSNRIKDLNRGIDRTREVSNKKLKVFKKIKFTSRQADLRKCNVYIVTVPTPIFSTKKPNLNFLKIATQLVGRNLKKDDIVIYESTVYPGTTEEYCVPILEKVSGLKYNNDFYCGYSPERTNPGDKKHTVSNVIKVTSGSTSKVSKIINELYKEIVKAGTYLAPSIKVAEAAKVIENTQRDLNIALMNELTVLFKKMKIDFGEILKVASTKWNFIPFKPGLVGGHCIGVDPYYLTYKAKKIGYNPKIILAGRKLNDGMSNYVVNQLIKKLKNKKIKIKNSRILIMGLTFKENCSDFRNSKVINIIKRLIKLGAKIDLYDPHVSREDFFRENHLRVKTKIKSKLYDSIVIAVAHTKFKKMGISKIKKLGKNNSIIYDIKQMFDKSQTDLQL